MREFVAVIALRYPEVYSSLEPMGDAEALNALNRYKFGTLSTYLEAFHRFTQWTERLQANLGTALGRIMRLIGRFAEMERNRKEYAGTCRAGFCQRILDTANLAQLVLGFLVKPDGLGWYLRLPDEWVTGPGSSRSNSFGEAADGFRFISKRSSVAMRPLPILSGTTTCVRDSIGKGSRRLSSGSDSVL
jgi:hypothetical protein